MPGTVSPQKAFEGRLELLSGEQRRRARPRRDCADRCVVDQPRGGVEAALETDT